MKIALDAMGGDFAPACVIEGACEYLKENQDVQIILVGDKNKISCNHNLISIKHASDVIEMQEHPVEALRRKRDSSIMNCIRLLQDQKVDAVISAGNTGATVAAAIFKLGLLEGVRKSGILVPIPSENSQCCLIDAGANMNSKPIHLLQYALMGTVYMQVIGQNRPVVGLLNVGKEGVKGTQLLRQSYQLFKRFLDNFGGNIEGHEVFSGKANVIVCDGLIGNIILKMGEGLTSLFTSRLTRGSDPEFREQVARSLTQFDYSEYGGAPLLGINGIVLICHGRSNAKAIKNAIKTAVNLVSKQVTNIISAELRKLTLWRRFQKWLEEKVKE